MGLVLDSSILIAAEREHWHLSGLFERLAQDLNETDHLISAVSVMELEHG